jgi:hypothetical protein
VPFVREDVNDIRFIFNNGRIHIFEIYKNIQILSVELDADFAAYFGIRNIPGSTSLFIITLLAVIIYLIPWWLVTVI